MPVHISRSEALDQRGDLMSKAWIRSDVLKAANIKTYNSCFTRTAATKYASLDRKTMVGGRRGCGRSVKARQAMRTKPCKVSEDRESMGLQLSHTDIHTDDVTKERLSEGSRFGTGFSENTPPPGDCPTEAL